MSAKSEMKYRDRESATSMDPRTLMLYLRAEYGDTENREIIVKRADLPAEVVSYLKSPEANLTPRGKQIVYGNYPG